MRRWRKPQPEPVDATPAEVRQPEPVDATPVEVQQPAPAGQQEPPYRGDDPRLPGVAGYGIGGMTRNRKRRHMPGTRFTFVRPDGKPE
jgi:hypothetical protein